MLIMIKNCYEFGLIMYEVLSLSPLSIYKPILERHKLVETRKTSPFNIIRFWGGRGVMKKCTLCALVKMVIIVNDPLPQLSVFRFPISEVVPEKMRLFDEYL